MRYDLENIYKILPVDNDIKYNIYTQMYKNHATIDKPLKDDLITYFLLYEILVIYEETKVADEIDRLFFLYSLYNDLIHTNFYNRNVEDDALMFYDLYLDNFNNFDYKYHSMCAACDSINNLISISDCYVLKRIKYYWRLLSPKKRKVFHSKVKNSL